MSRAESGTRLHERTSRDRRARPARVYGYRGLTALILAGAVAACAGTPPPERPDLPRGLPPVPAVDGPLDLRVSYPRDSLAIETRDRNFIFGSAGSGAARVWINGEEVDVAPNGGFLAFLPVPESGVYRLRAVLGRESQTLEVPVRLPPPPPEPGTRALIVDGSIFPAGGWVALPGERIEVGFTGTAGGEAWLELGDERIPLTAMAPPTEGVTEFEVRPVREGGGSDSDESVGSEEQGLDLYRGVFAARRIVSTDATVPWPTLTGEPRLPWPDADAAVVLHALGDTVRKPLPLNLLPADPTRPRVGVGLDLDPAARNGDGRVIGRPGPGSGPYHYVWANGVELEFTGERNGAYRVRLTDDLSAWTPASDVRLRADGTPPPASRVPVVRLDPQPDRVDIRVPLHRRLPYRVEEDERSVTLVVYGAVSRVNFLQHGRVDPYIERAEWRQPSDREFRLEIRLGGPVWGHETLWSGGDLVLRLNRPPAIDPEAPLRGLTIGVDPGHGGADTLTMGPTGLTEADANLGVALALRDALRDRGARVVMTRTSNAGTSLVERTELARRRDVDVWISVHNNAFPDGVEPWSNSGTSVYYNHPRAAGLAWSIQRALLATLETRDLGVGRADLHQPRFTWAPSVLTETLFMMIPEHEAFLKTEAGRRRVAMAHVRGLEAWLRELARQDR
ncbi:MAG: N-acetylmuramoyl-L-alanine amidase [Candidatus Longimicrobiales bacterium M2_2A_002]